MPVDRPPPEPAKLLAAWRDWEAGDALPGRTMASLKTGALPDFLAATATAAQEAGADASQVASIIEAWQEWERGAARPEPTLQALRERGLGELLERSAAAHEEAFGAG